MTHSAATPADVVSLADYADETGRPLTTLRTYRHRYEDFPAPWRKGRGGETDLYLRVALDRWMRKHAAQS